MPECIYAEKADMRLMFGQANGSKCVARLEDFPHRHIPYLKKSSAIGRRLRENGTCNVHPSDRGRTQAVLTFEREVIFLGMICGNS